MSPTRPISRFTHAATTLMLGLLPALVLVEVLRIAAGAGHFALDFSAWYWPAGVRVLHGLSPYTVSPNPLDYPAFSALVFVPFALVPHVVANWLFLGLVLAAVPGSLWLLGVRDLRVLGCVMLWQPVFVGYETANVSLLLLLGVAALWRWRDRPATAGLLLAVMVSVKILLFPLGLWLLLSGRRRALAHAILGTFVINLISWAVLGFGQVPVYVHLLSAFAGRAEHRGYSMIGLLLRLGTPQLLADAVALAACAAVLALALAGREQRDRRAFSACVAICLLGSTLVESHYLTLLIAPLALLRPRLGRLWALPVLLVITPADHPNLWQHALSVALVGVLVISVTRVTRAERTRPRLRRARTPRTAGRPPSADLPRSPA